MYPCVLFALNREARPFYRLCQERRKVAPAPCPVSLCTLPSAPSTQWMVLETGVGSERSQAMLRWLAEEHLSTPPRFLVSAGFCGALQDDYPVGSVIVASEVVSETREVWPCRPPAGCEPFGRLLTTGRLIGDPHEKQRLGQQYQALAVDMESSVLAHECARRNIPFASIRAVSDDVRTALSPKLLDVLNQADASTCSLIKVVLRSPGLVLEMWRLARQTHLAARALARVLAGL